jgi:hypothetical protein
LTYPDIAETEGVTLCATCWAGDICPAGLRAEVDGTTIHWRSRRVTRPGLRNFLKLVMRIHSMAVLPLTEWEALHNENVYAYHAARAKYHVLLPKHLSRQDRVRAWSLLLHKTPKPQPQWQWAKEAIR